jgi:hypothetical protein
MITSLYIYFNRSSVNFVSILFFLFFFEQEKKMKQYGTNRLEKRNIVLQKRYILNFKFKKLI